MADQREARAPAAKAGFAFAGDDPLRHVESFPGAIANLSPWKLQPPETGFSINMSSGITWSAGFR